MLSAFTVAGAFVCVVGHAEAHEPPTGTGVYANGNRLAVRMSRGLVLRGSQLQDYRFLCNEALGVAEYDVPSVLVRGDGSLLVGTSTGLKHVSPDGCGIDSSPALDDARVTALVQDPHDSARVYAATAIGFYESRDQGEHFVQRDEHAFDSLEVPNRTQHVVFATGKLPSPAGHARAYIARWQSANPLDLHELALEPTEYGVALLGSDAEHVVAVARAYLGTTYPDRLLVSSDGARTWRNPLSAPQIAAFVVEPSSGAWLLGDATGLRRMSATGEPSVQLSHAAVSCLAYASSQLYICDDAGISVSADGGEHARSLLRWNQVAGLAPCATDAPAVQLCESAWQDWTRELPSEPPPVAHAENTLPSGADAPQSCAAISSVAPERRGQLPRWITLVTILRIMQRLYRKRSPMTKKIGSLILGAGLALGLLSGCANEAKREAGTTESDAGPRSGSDASDGADGGTAPEPNRIEDAAQSGRADSGQATQSTGGSEAAGGSGGRASDPSAGAGGHEPAITAAGTSASEPDSDAGPGEPGPLCASCGGCEEVIEVTSTMHTNNPVTYPDPPPTSGPHNPCWGRWGVHDVPLAAERWVHNLEHGGVIFLYNCPDGCDQEVAAIKQINRHRHRTIITAYDDLPTRFGVVSWGHRLLSDCLDLDAFNAFYEQNFDHAPESNGNPPNPNCPP